MSVQLSIEEEVKKLQKHFGGVVQLVKSLKTSVEALEKENGCKGSRRKQRNQGDY